MTELYDQKILRVSCDDRNTVNCTDLFLQTEVTFDGRFYVAKIPAGTKFYTGTLAQDEMLVHSFGTVMLKGGLDISDVGIQVNGPDQFPSQLYQETGPSWFGGKRDASMYASLKNCSECVYVYTLKRDAIFLVLPNAYNLAKLFFAFLTNKEEGICEGLCEIFPGLDKLIEKLVQTPEYINRKTPLNWMKIDLIKSIGYDIRRMSYGEIDFYVSVAIKKLFEQTTIKYDGYMAPSTKKVDSTMFHEEVMLFNPYTTLDRDFTNPIDASNTAVKFSTGPILQAFRERLENTGLPNDNTQWAYTVWSLLYAEKLIERFKMQQFLNLDSTDTRFIAFATLVHEISDDYEELARELGVTLDQSRREIIKLVQSRFDHFEDIVHEVNKNPSDYFTDSNEYLFNVEIPYCEDFREPKLVSKCNDELSRDMKIYPKEKLTSLIERYYGDLNRLQLETLLIVSIAHVLGRTPYGRGRVTKYDGSLHLKNLVASSHYFPINNQYRVALGSPKRSMIMRKIGIIIGQIALIKH